MAAICMAFMREAGLVDYKEKVVKYWPEFGNKNKQDMTVAEIMKHEAGMSKMNTQISSEELYTENIKKNSIGKIFEDEEALYPAGFKRQYH